MSMTLLFSHMLFRDNNVGYCWRVHHVPCVRILHQVRQCRTWVPDRYVVHEEEQEIFVDFCFSSFNSGKGLGTKGLGTKGLGTKGA